MGIGGRYREAEDANQIQYNIVRVDGQKSVYVPIMKQGGDTNTIQVVNGVRDMIPAISWIFRNNWWPPWCSTSRSL